MSSVHKPCLRVDTLDATSASRFPRDTPFIKAAQHRNTGHPSWSDPINHERLCHLVQQSCTVTHVQEINDKIARTKSTPRKLLTKEEARRRRLRNLAASTPSRASSVDLPSRATPDNLPVFVASPIAESPPPPVRDLTAHTPLLLSRSPSPPTLSSSPQPSSPRCPDLRVDIFGEGSVAVNIPPLESASIDSKVTVCPAHLAPKVICDFYTLSHLPKDAPPCYACSELKRVQEKATLIEKLKELVYNL